MLVCHCRKVSDRAIRAAVREGAENRLQVMRACRAGTGCGGCQAAIDQVIEDERGEASTGSLVGLRLA